MNTPAGPRTAREALLAEALGDLDRLLARVEAMPGLVEGTETRLVASAKTLDEAGDRFRLAVTQFLDAAKKDLAEFHEAQRGQVAAREAATLSEHTRTLQETARATLRAELAVLLARPGADAAEIHARLNRASASGCCRWWARRCWRQGS